MEREINISSFCQGSDGNGGRSGVRCEGPCSLVLHSATVTFVNGSNGASPEFCP